MELDVAPDGRVFYIERDGRLRIVKPDTGTTVTAGTLPVFTGNEDGLFGLTLDPNFATTRWVYLYYSPTGGSPRNLLSRFTINGDTLDLASERVLLTVATQRNTCCHAGGTMTFDGAGNLYLATGDNTNPFESGGYSPLDERQGRADNFTVQVSDPEDGAVDCSRVVLQYSFGHDEHAHPIQQYQGCSGTVQTSLESGHGADANVFAVLEASYVDNHGLPGRALIRLHPKRKQAEHFTST
jgi:glucose/arabinose dehydrogenase